MPLTKSLFIIVLLALCLAFCNQGKDSAYKEISTISDAQVDTLSLRVEKEVILDTGTDIIGSIIAFAMVGDNFLIMDTIHSRQCYLFHGDGKLLKKIGSYGEGPGQYFMVMAACCSGDRIFLFSGPIIHIYDKNGEFLKKTMRPFFGYTTAAYPGPNGSVYALSYSRYNTDKNTIYHLDQDGALIKSFSPTPSGIPGIFDVYHPSTGLCLEKTTFFQHFNFRYRFTQFDYDGNKIKEIKFSSPFYTPPVFRNMSGKGLKGEKEYRLTFTLVNGLFSYSQGYVVILVNWKNDRESQNIFEFRNKDFKRIGYFEITGDEFPLGVYNDRIITADFENETKLIFRKVNLNS